MTVRTCKPRLLVVMRQGVYDLLIVFSIYPLQPTMNPLRTAMTILAFVGASTAFAQVYKCADAGGKTVYAQTPCTQSGGNAQKVKISAAPAADPKPSGQAAGVPSKGVSPTPRMVIAPPRTVPVDLPPPSKRQQEQTKMRVDSLEFERAERQRQINENRQSNRQNLMDKRPFSSR